MTTTTTSSTYSGTIAALPVATKKPSSYLSISVFDAAGHLIAEIMLDKALWLSRYHPLVDCPEERKALGVSEIVADHYGSLGRFEARWTVHYAADGTLVEAFEHRDDTAHNQSDLTAILRERFRWLVPVAGQ